MVRKNNTILILITSIFAFNISVEVFASLPARTEKYNKGQSPLIDKNLLKGNSLSFTPNKGQIADMDGNHCPDVLYKGDGGGADIYLRKTGISYVYTNMGEVMHKVDEQVEELIKAGTITEAEEHEKKDELMHKECRSLGIKIHRVDMDFANCNQNINATNEDELDGYLNFYYAHCPNGVLNVKQYNKVTYKNIYNGIDVSYYGNKKTGIKYDLVVKPHTDPNQIKLHWKGAENIYINREGNLVIKTSINEFYESIPKVYQVINGKIVDVKAEYLLESKVPSPESQVATPMTNDSRLTTQDYFVSFKLSNYQTDFPLVIDPWATYFGGSGPDSGVDICTDNVGNPIIIGNTTSAIFPVLAGAYTQAYGGNNDAFIAKFNPAGTCAWASYYGGNSNDVGQGIAADNAGNVVITGYTHSANFPILTPAGAYAQVLSGSVDAFVVKFNNSGVRIWSTFYGGSNTDYGQGIVADNTGNIFFTGWTLSVNFPSMISVGAYAQAFGGSSEAFIVKFDLNGVRKWATYYGGSNADNGKNIAVDNANNVVITGYSMSINLPVTIGAAYGGAQDAFVVKFNAVGALAWATYYGGSGSDGGTCIATDTANSVVISGYTSSSNFPVVTPPVSYSQVYGGGFLFGDAFVAKFSSAGTPLWASYYGLATEEWAAGISTDGSNNIYLFMEVEDPTSPSLVADACSYQPVFNGGSTTNSPGNHAAIEDQLIVKFSPVGKKTCSTFMGGTGEDDLDFGGGIAIYANSIYITASTDGGYPVTAGAYQSVFVGTDFVAFVTSLCTNICEGKTLGLNFTASNLSVCPNVPIVFTPTITNSCDTIGYRFHWVFTGGNPASSDSVKPTVTFSVVGTHNVKLVVTTVCKKDSITKINYITINSCGCSLTASTTTTSANCGNNSGTTSANPVGGSSSYTYLWNNGQTTQTATGLAAGNYTVTITDVNSCTATAIANIIASAPLVGQFAKGTANCTSCGCKEWIMVTASGGTSPYSYNWSDGYVTRYKNNLCPGAYTINIKDKNGCSINVNLSVP